MGMAAGAEKGAESGRRRRARVVAAAWVLAAAYLAFRAACSLDPASPVYSALFLAAEAAGLAIGLATCTVVALGEDEPLAPGAAPPSGVEADVLVLAGDEAEPLVRRTALAARALEGPHHTWICDPRGRPELAALAREIGVGYAAAARPEEARADLVLLLRAGDLARRQLLARVLPRFADPRLALAQVARLPPRRETAAERRARVLARGAGGCGAAPFLGSGAVLRRAAAPGPRAAFVDEALLFGDPSPRAERPPVGDHRPDLPRSLVRSLFFARPLAAVAALAFILAPAIFAGLGSSPLRPTPLVLAVLFAVHLSLDVALPRLVGAPAAPFQLDALLPAGRPRAEDAFPLDLPSAIAAEHGVRVTLVLLRRLGRARAAVLSHEPLAPGAHVFLDLAALALARPVRALVLRSTVSRDARHPGILLDLALEGLATADEEAIDRAILEIGLPRLAASLPGAPPGPPPDGPAAGVTAPDERVIFDTKSGFIRVKSSALVWPGRRVSDPRS
jgi:hypothetical protein